MSAAFDNSVPAGKRHRTLCEVDLLVYDYDQMAVKTVTLPAKSIFQPWEPHDDWRGEKVSITLGDLAWEFDWGVSAGEGHFLRWDDFFSNCELAEDGVTLPVTAGKPEESPPQGTLPPTSDRDQEHSPSSTKLTSAISTQELFDLDARGRTRLFYAAERGLRREVEEMISNLPGTGFYSQRLGLIEIKDKDGLTAADVAEQNGHTEIADLLRFKAWLMETFG